MQPGPNPVLASIEGLLRAGRSQDAVALLGRATDEGDGDASFLLGLWHLGGQFVPTDVAKARDLFRRAGEYGRLDGMKVHANFLASGTGGPADWPGALALLGRLAQSDAAAGAALALIQRMELAPDGSPPSIPEGETISESPRVLRFPRLFTEAECDYLIALATPMMQPSVVVDEATGRLIPHPIRTSDGAAFPWVAADPAVTALNRRIAAASATGLDQGEPLQVLRYRPGQQYRNHFDAIQGVENQRILTMLVYLNEEFEGGETCFVRTDVKFRGEKGDGLLFHNVRPDGQPDPLSEHAGAPVTSGVKYLASRWIRQQPFMESR